MSEIVKFYNALASPDIYSAKSTLTDVLSRIDTSPETYTEYESVDLITDKNDEDLPLITPKKDLLGIEPSVYDLINQSLTIKRHLLFYGPPGTGKTTLAEYVASIIGNGKYKLITGTSDWTSQDIIGGYQPAGGGKIKFAKGLILENFDRPIIIDELNRVDIDKAIGPLFTVLSGQQTTLPYQLEPDSDEPGKRERVHILPYSSGNLSEHQFAPTSKWRLLATMNSIDKASLYQMSYALSRRFAWILIDVPQDLSGFIKEYLNLSGKSVGPLVIEDSSKQIGSPNIGFETGDVTETYPRPEPLVLAQIWQAINFIRPIGAAPIIDIINLCLNAKEDFDFEDSEPDIKTANLYLNGIYAFLLPLLDGILQSDAKHLVTKILEILNIRLDSKEAIQVDNRILYHSI